MNLLDNLIYVQCFRFIVLSQLATGVIRQSSAVQL